MLHYVWLLPCNYCLQWRKYTYFNIYLQLGLQALCHGASSIHVFKIFTKNKGACRQCWMSSQRWQLAWNGNSPSSRLWSSLVIGLFMGPATLRRLVTFRSWPVFFSCVRWAINKLSASYGAIYIVWHHCWHCLASRAIIPQGTAETLLLTSWTASIMKCPK